MTSTVKDNVVETKTSVHTLRGIDRWQDEVDIFQYLLCLISDEPIPRIIIRFWIEAELSGKFEVPRCNLSALVSFHCETDCIISRLGM